MHPALCPGHTQGLTGASQPKRLTDLPKVTRAVRGEPRHQTWEPDARALPSCCKTTQAAPGGDLEVTVGVVGTLQKGSEQRKAFSCLHHKSHEAVFGIQRNWDVASQGQHEVDCPNGISLALHLHARHVLTEWSQWHGMTDVLSKPLKAARCDPGAGRCLFVVVHVTSFGENATSPSRRPLRHPAITPHQVKGPPSLCSCAITS